ncbi:MAG: amidohydrolase [Firmicutes bacterium]|nr:amidohydrolase [Bacillota bacterium]
MLIDVHVHLFPPDVIANIEKYLEKNEFLAQLCSSPRHKYATAEDLLAEMDKCGIDKSAISGFASSDQGLCREMNDYILEMAKAHPQRFLPMAVVDPLDPGMEKEIRRCHEMGAVGVGELMPWGQKFPLDGKEAGKLASICSEKKLPLLLHINETVGHYYAGKGDVSVEEAAAFALKYPQLTIIYAHWGGGLLFYELMPELKDQLQNVYYDTAASPFLYHKNIYRVAREIGILHKVLLGTDYPLISPKRYLKELQETGLSQKEVEMIAGGNAARLFSNC